MVTDRESFKMATIQQNSEFIIFVTHVEAEHQFLRIWGQIDKNSATYVERMILPLFEKFAIGSGYPELQEGLSINALCCARFQNDGYYRARVCNICPDGKVVLQFIDYGNIEILPQHEVYLLRNIPGSETLQSFPPVAYEFTLANIIPINNVWDNKTIETIKKILRYNEYKACCLSTVRNHTFIKLYYNNEDFGELLVKRNMAMDATMQDLFRPRRIQQISPYHMQDRRMINEARIGTQSNANPAFNTMQGQGAWQNVSTPYVQPQKLVPHAPVQEALVFKSRVLDVGSKYHVYVSFVEDGPQKFSVQVQSTSEILTKLMRDINSHPMEPLQEPPLPGSVCLGRYTIDKVLCRAVVMAVMENKCKLYYVDFGHSEVLSYTDIFQLPPQYINPRVLSIRFTLSGVKELNVTPEMTEYFKKIVSGRSLVLHVRPPEGPPLIQYGDLYDNEKNIKDILRQAFTVPVTVSNMVVYQEPQKLSKGAERTVHVSFVESYMKFFIQLDNSDKSLESIMIYLADYVKTAPTLHPNQISVGTPCAALYESQWYRAKILNVDGDKIRILYVDYGNEVTVTAESLRLPAQAIKCILRDYNTLPTGEECYNQFEMLILEKSLYMAVIDVLPGGLLVDLYDPEIRDDIKNILHRLFPSEKNLNIKSNSHECEHQSSIKVPKKIQRYYTKIPLNIETQVKSKSKNIKEIRDNVNKGNKANQEDPTKNMPIEHTKSKPWKNDLNGERQDNRYEKSNSSHDNSRNDRSSKDRLKNNNTKKDEPYNKRNYNDSNSFYKVGRDSRSRGRSFGNDSRFNRSSGFDKNWSDKDSDTSSRSSGKRGRGSGPNRHSHGRPRTEGVSARLHNSRWNDNDNDKEVNKSGKTNSQYNQKMHHSKDRANYKNNVTSNKESSSESRDMSENLGTINNSMQNNEKLQLSKLSSENIEIPSLNIILGAIKTCMTVFISSPTDFYIQLNPDYLELDTLMENIASTYENGGDLLKQSEIKPEKYCIAQYSEDLKWYRAVIKSVEKQQVIVQFIDYGNIEIVHLDKIKTIQEQFLKLPIQTIHCKLFAAKNQIWDLDAIESFSNRTDGKVLEIEFLTKDNNIYEVMLREIINNVPEPIYINEDFFDGTDIMKVRETALNQIKQIDIVEQSSEYDYVSSNSKWAKEQFELGSHKDIIITWFINPNNFYCQILDKEVEFRNMMNEIQRMYVNRKPVTYTLQVGAAVIAIFSEDKALYRAEIIENKSDEYIVQYIDFGNRALVNKSDIYQVEKKLMQLPKQAYHCSLQNIKPFIGSKWSEVNTQAIDDCFNADKYGCLFHNIENDKYIVSLNNCRQDVADILVNKNLASYAIVNTIMPTDENSTNELDKSLDIQKIDINLLNGQTLKVRVCNVQSASKFHIELSSIMESSNDKCIINKNFKMLTDTQNQPIECCLLNASSFETNKNWKEIIENKELIMYVEEVNNNRLIIKLYDLMGNKIKSQKDLDEKIYPICPMPILNQTYKIIVSYADHSGSIWLQRSVDYDKNIHLSQALEEHYANCGKTLKPEIDMLCAVKVADGYWNRAKIIKFTDKSVYVNFIDYGNTQEVSIESLMELDPQFFVPYQLAINASLTVTLNGTLSEQINILQDQLSNRNLTANFSNVNKKWIVELFDNEEKISDKLRSMNLVKSLAENESENYQLITGKKYNVRVSHIDSPSQFWIQLTNEAEILKRKYVELQADISTCPLIDGILEESSLCVAVYSIDNMWYRAEVLDADEDITTVRFIDYGNTDVIDNKSENIRALTDNLKSMKRYATKSRLDIIPVDSEDWSEATCDRFSNLVTTADSLEALIIADSIPKRVELFVNDKSISEILVEEHHAVRIYAEQDLIDEIVELELDPHSAFVSHINSPSEFWVQEEKSIADLEVMSDRFMVADMFPKVDEIKENLLCVAKFPEDEQWYRARVISHYNGETKVIYIDYGNSAISTEIRTIPEDLVKIAPLSRRCSLVLPEGLTKWSNEACQEFTKLAADGATIFLLDVLKEQEISLVRLTLNEKNVTDLLAVFCEKQITDIEERLPPLGEENSPNVVVSHVNTPAEFWVQAEASIAELEVMSDRLQAAPSFLPLTNLENGTICAAKYPDDEQWYRAKILSQNESGVNVLYIDYGNTAINTELRILPEDIVNIPTLSKRCALQIPYYISFWSEEACKTFKDLAADGATMFQFEILDNEDPMHVKLSIDGKDITEILLPLCKDTNTKSEKCIVVEQITNSNIELYNKLTNTKENPEKLNELTQKSTNTIVCSVNEKSSTELLEQEHIHESVTASIEETNSFTNITELSIDDIIKNMIEDTHRDSENEDSINIENIEITMQSSSENLITQEISKADNNFDINYDLIINDGDNKREDDKDEKRSTNLSILVMLMKNYLNSNKLNVLSEETDLKAVENIETNEKFPDKEETKYSLNILVSEETDLKVVVNTETSEKCLDKEETKYFPDMLVSKETDLKVVENIEISEKFPDKEETKCSPNMLISEETDLKVTENTEAIEKSLDKQKITCSPNTFLSNVDVSQNSMKQEKITCSLDSSETEKPGTNIAIEGILKKDTEKSKSPKLLLICKTDFVNACKLMKRKYKQNNFIMKNYDEKMN
ncbi:LOW QUALITY PROTEIN: maternal protein tudor-like isoform X1 [Vespula maculifrons]|uniref:Maternal protein tudor-like isoform X1 n=1 Tax=Vespula maculifrons TaxID=7453 RepID=A0ABD2B8T5_VESMC